MTEEQEERIDALRKRCLELRDELQKTKKEFDEALIEVSKFKVGMTVRVKGGKVFRICQIVPMSDYPGSTLSLYGHPKLKDGSFGTSRRYISSMAEIVEEKPC